MINWKLRIKNKTTLVALCALFVSFIYKFLSTIGIAPAVSESSVMEVGTLIVDLLCAVGIVVDPTTVGIKDSYRAMTYSEPKSD